MNTPIDPDVQADALAAYSMREASLAAALALHTAGSPTDRAAYEAAYERAAYCCAAGVPAAEALADAIYYAQEAYAEAYPSNVAARAAAAPACAAILHIYAALAWDAACPTLTDSLA